MRYLAALTPHWEERQVRAAALIIHRATHEVFHHLYRHAGSIDEETVLGEFTKMIERYLCG